MNSAEKPDADLEKREFAKEALGQLEKLLNDWSDEIPEEILHGEGKYKVRVNWWNSVTGWLNVLLRKELIADEALIERIRAFVGTYAGRDYWAKGHKNTSKEDIIIANSLLEDVTKNLRLAQ